MTHNCNPTCDCDCHRDGEDRQAKAEEFLDSLVTLASELCLDDGPHDQSTTAASLESAFTELQLAEMLSVAITRLAVTQ